jgi:hypothetical protein
MHASRTACIKHCYACNVDSVKLRSMHTVEKVFPHFQFQNRRMKWKKEQKYSTTVSTNCHLIANEYQQSATAMAMQLQHQQHQAVRNYLLSNCDQRAACGYYPSI